MYQLDLTSVESKRVYYLGEKFRGSDPEGQEIGFTNAYMTVNGRPFFGISGEMHFSRVSPDQWEDAIVKMQCGGVNILSTYVFWNVHEEEEGVFRFDGCRDLRAFLDLCEKHHLWVILRVGPFDHGEMRNGGLPDWLYGKPFEVRTTNAAFLACVRRLYAQIGQQVRGLFYQDGGPVIGVQLDNEYMHSSAPWEITTGISDEWVFKGDEGEKYILALRDIALECGLTPAFFTGTAWGGAAYSPRVMPLWGGYPYRPWIFYSHKGEHPATEEYIYEDYHHNGKVCADDFTPEYPPESRPYACCEMGGGMMCCYYYRFQYPYKSVDALANIKVGSGCNFIGYYMFQGGTNPLGRHGAYMNESQVPKRSYDYQAALGEFGQVRESYSRLKSIHAFMRYFGSRLAPMETVLPEGASQIDPRDANTLRFAVRTDGQSGFLFVNNFQDHLTLPRRSHERVRIETAAEAYDFDLSIASEENAILPFHFDMDGILLRQANAQPVLRTVIRGRVTYVFMVPDGMDGDMRFEPQAEIVGSKPLFTVRKGASEVDVLMISREMANQLFILRDGSLVFTGAALLEDERGALRLETTEAQNTLRCYPADRLQGTRAQRQDTPGPLGVYQLCTQPRRIEVAVENTAPRKYAISMPADTLEGLKDARLQISYRGDIGSLFLGAEMISDNFCNGALWEVGLLEHREALGVQPLVLSISPIREGARVNADSAMAARNEEVKALIADLTDVRVQPVYEIGI